MARPCASFRDNHSACGLELVSGCDRINPWSDSIQRHADQESHCCGAVHASTIPDMFGKLSELVRFFCGAVCAWGNSLASA